MNFSQVHNHKVLILEDKVVQKEPSSFDHVFSFHSAAADSFPEDYISQDEVEAIYEDTYEAICHHLKAEVHGDDFIYRGVDLLWCFKKAFFEFAYLARLRYETFKRVHTKFSESQFYLQDITKDSDYPRLAKLLCVSPLRHASKIHLTEGTRPITSNTKQKWTQKFKFLLPSFLTFGQLRACQIALFYDFDKLPRLIKRLKPYGCILVSDSQPRKTFRQAISNHLPLCQITYQSNQDRSCQDQTERFIERLGERRVFANFSLGELNAETLLRNKLEQLWHFHLPKFLFVIDRMHHFFSLASSLKSVLMDEDISPTRVAFCQIARQYRVRTFVECHGLIGGRHGFIPPNADKMFVWGKAQMDKLIRWGSLEEALLISGCSGYRHYQEMNGDHLRKKIAKKLNLNPSRKIALVAFPPILHSWFVIFEHKMRSLIQETLHLISNVAEQEDEIQFIVKLHPAVHDKSFYWEWYKRVKTPKQIVLVDKFDSLALAKAADFLIVYNSTYAVDGFAMNKPVILLYDDSSALEEFKEYSVFIYANSKQDLQDAIFKLIQSPQMKCGRWDEARRDCLNENGQNPEDIITAHLLAPDSSFVKA